MAKRRKKTEVEVKPTVTRKEYLRKHKDDRQRRALLSVLGVVLASLAVFLGFGLYREWQQLRTPVAQIEGETITATQFQERLEYERFQMLRNMANLSQLAQTTDPSFLQQLFGQQRSNLAQTTTDLLVDEALVRQEAESRGIEVVNADVDERLEREFAPLYATSSDDDVSAAEDEETSDGEMSEAAGDEDGDADVAAEPITDTLLAEAREAVTDAVTSGTITDSLAVLTDTLTASADVGDILTAADGITETVDVEDDVAMEGDEVADEVAATEAITDPVSATETAVAALPTLEPTVFEQAVRDYINPILTQTGLSRDAYWDIVRQQITRERLNEALGAEIPITDNQVELDYLVFSDMVTAQQASDALSGGGTWSDVTRLFERPPATPTPVAGDETDVLTDTVGADLMEQLGTETTITTTEGITVTDQADDAGDGDLSASEGITSTDELTATDSITATDELTSTDAITTTDSITPTVAPSPTPAPTATPDPYAQEVGERRWFTRDGIKDRFGFGDEDTNTVLALGIGEASAPLSGSGRFYVFTVVDADEMRELEETEIEQRRETAIDDWLTTRRTIAAIDRYDFLSFVTPEPDWFVSGYQQYAGPSVVQPTLDLSQLGQPTVESAP